MPAPRPRPSRLHETEAGFQEWVVAYAHTQGWMVAHFKSVLIEGRGGKRYYATPVAADGAGWPDLVLVRERVVYAELKQVGKTPTARQLEWHRALEAAGQEIYVWCPRDRQKIVSVLSYSQVRSV